MTDGGEASPEYSLLSSLSPLSPLSLFRTAILPPSGRRSQELDPATHPETAAGAIAATSLAAGGQIANLLTVDVEEYYHAIVFQEGIRHLSVPTLESRVEASVDRILELLGNHNAPATFFVLGEVAAGHSHMVKRISQGGHEVACHGHEHKLVSERSPQQFREDIRRAKLLLENLVGKAVLGYRAPSFSIGGEQAWAFDILLEEGFRYDSSIYPIRHDRYGQPDAPRFAHRIRANGHGNLFEFPIGTVRSLGINLPIGGGGYFRLAPFAFFRWGIRRVNRRDAEPVVFYFHPWELDPLQPHFSMPWRHRLRHRLGMSGLERKLTRLLRTFRFTTIQKSLPTIA